ncbi:hypothetical protein VOLCADRAFT_87908 [Volvox carteri f. nagariensis]|uniref:Pherophorin domain-containing protein n=1 Tax=Volvox carteri f. nagariensis TaxID=3068 RepID=D8TMJ9_VOLCA|nr:uncharacterized protein VOLCADRAFT_87908 [Volvox carteri f. nagariensis]EFJ51269.1 hypothetical protein VOLCADRAFT_87908 [Volvox carteri f. nagariensis]|eukprot:XP_002947736.1 hypothetical protein VOLCADRAFT_87908 [Volvox carteri f. nagariensis]
MSLLPVLCRTVLVVMHALQLTRYYNYPYTSTSSAEMALMVTDLSTLGLATEGLEVCYETRGCNDWAELCRSGVPGSPEGCRFSLSTPFSPPPYPPPSPPPTNTSQPTPQAAP